MLSPMTKLVITAAVVATGSFHAAEGVTFQSGSNGKVMFGNNCDFAGNDLYAVKASSQSCGDLCASDISCTHWSWEPQGGCWLKKWLGGGVTLRASDKQGVNCGYLVKCYSNV